MRGANCFAVNRCPSNSFSSTNFLVAPGSFFPDFLGVRLDVCDSVSLSAISGSLSTTGRLLVNSSG